MILSYNLYGRVACMKIKAVLRSLFLAYALTGICLLLLAFLVFQMDIGTGPVTVGIIVIYVISCMAGGFLAERSPGERNTAGAPW